MPRKNAAGTSPDWDALYQSAVACAGYLTATDAHQAGFSNQLLRYYVQNGRLERAAHGIYRFVHFPSSEHEDLAVIWLWSDRKGVFSHVTALALYGLSDAMPALRELTVPLSWKKRRIRVPSGVELHYALLDGNEVGWFGPVPVTSVARTIRDCTHTAVSPDLMAQARGQVLRRGLMSEPELERVLQ